MKAVCFQPESFQYFLNSDIFYVTGIILEPIFDENAQILKRGADCQLVFKSSVPNFDKEKLFTDEVLIVQVQNYVRDCKVKGREGKRLTVISFDEDNLWRNI